MSIPRDSYVDIPGNGMNKINAAYSIGGPKLLARTVEQSTGLRVDGYMEIGFGGFANVVDAVDGVRICLKAPMKDEKAHIDLPKGCQVLDGKNALGYVRARYSDPEGDLGRVKRQRQFLGALLDKVASPADVLLPWRLHSLGTSPRQRPDDRQGRLDDRHRARRPRAAGHRPGQRQLRHRSGVEHEPLDVRRLGRPVGRAEGDQLFSELKNDQPLTIDPTGG